MSTIISCGRHSPLPDKKEQNLRINLRKEPVSLDPRKGNDMVASQLHFMLFEGLIKLNPDMSISPAQATSYDISDDWKVYTFHLGKNKWSDGTPVTAYDFEKTWKDLLLPDFPTHDAYLLYCIKNAEKAKKGQIAIEEVGIRATDASTLIVELEKPTPHFLQVVACSVLLPINHDLERKDNLWATSAKNFISNGPFRLQEWKLNEAIVLEKNPHYRNTREVKLNHIFIEIIDNEMATLHMYASGHFDLLGCPLSFFPSLIHQDLTKKKLLQFVPVANSKFLAFNNKAFPFNNKEMRKAFSYAIHRKALVEHITQLEEEAALNVVPSVLLSTPSKPFFKDADVAAAQECFKKGLEELKIQKEDLKNITFMYVANEVNHLLAQELQEQWKKAFDVKVQLQHVEFKTLHERAKKENFSMGLFAWVAEYHDPMNILERFRDSTSHRNYSKWQNEHYNQILDEAMTVSSQNEYLTLLRQAEGILMEEMVFAPLFHCNYAFLIQPHVKGFDISPLGHIYFEKISIDR